MDIVKNLNLKIKIAIASIIVIVMIAIGGIVFYHSSLQAVSSTSQEVIVEIPEGSSGQQIIAILDDNDLIKNDMVAKLYLRFHNYSFKSNTYILNKNMDLETLLTVIEEAKDDYIANTQFTVLDGNTIPQYASVISEATGLSQDDILNTWQDQEQLTKWVEEYWFLTDDIFNENIYFPLEGYLWPDTYQVALSKNNVVDITEMMLDQTEKQLTPYQEQIESYQINGQTVSIHQFLTLSSMVQRESPANNDDQQLITGVFLNRLQLPMRLQSDVTVNYANQETKVAVTYKDLENESLYNTYRHDGLPIGPISSMSKQVIDNVLSYQTSDYYFFFATQDGQVIYSKTYQEHQNNVNNNRWY